MLDIPDPVSMFESAKNAGLEREEVNALVSCFYSAAIAFLWASGSAKWALWAGEGQAMKDQATVTYLSLHALQAKKFLTLTVPKDLLSADNLSRFQTEQLEK